MKRYGRSKDRTLPLSVGADRTVPTAWVCWYEYVKTLVWSRRRSRSHAKLMNRKRCEQADGFAVPSAARLAVSIARYSAVVNRLPRGAPSALSRCEDGRASVSGQSVHGPSAPTHCLSHMPPYWRGKPAGQDGS